MTPRRLVPSMLAGLCPVCAGSGMMPRSAPVEARVPCDGCRGEGVLA